MNGGWNGGETTFTQAQLKVQHNPIQNNDAGDTLFEAYSANHNSTVADSPNSAGVHWWSATGTALYDRLVTFHNGEFGNNAQRSCYP